METLPNQDRDARRRETEGLRRDEVVKGTRVGDPQKSGSYLPLLLGQGDQRMVESPQFYTV